MFVVITAASSIETAKILNHFRNDSEYAEPDMIHGTKMYFKFDTEEYCDRFEENIKPELKGFNYSFSQQF